MERVQLIAICASLLFLAYIGYLIVKGKLREEYSIVWLVCTAVLIAFSFWRSGLDYFSELMGIKDPPNKLKIGEVPVVIRERLGGHSSIEALGPLYYMVKVSIAMIFTALRRD